MVAEFEESSKRTYAEHSIALAGLWCVLPVLLFLQPGCVGDGRDAYRAYDLGAAEPTVASAIEASGGLDAWRNIGRIRANVLMTIYENGGQAYVNSQMHDLDVNAGKLTVRAATAARTWQATCTSSGGFSLSGASALGRLSPERLQAAMSLVLHRVTGPLNLLSSRERPLGQENISSDGRRLVRVKVDGDADKAIAYYFDAVGGMLRMVTSGSEDPGQAGTVTVYSYQTLANGMEFPRKLRVVRTGQHLLVGQPEVMEVEYTEVTVE